MVREIILSGFYIGWSSPEIHKVTSLMLRRAGGRLSSRPAEFRPCANRRLHTSRASKMSCSLDVAHERRRCKHHRRHRHRAETTRQPGPNRCHVSKDRMKPGKAAFVHSGMLCTAEDQAETAKPDSSQTGHTVPDKSSYDDTLLTIRGMCSGCFARLVFQCFRTTRLETARPPATFLRIDRRDLLVCSSDYFPSSYLLNIR